MDGHLHSYIFGLLIYIYIYIYIDMFYGKCGHYTWSCCLVRFVVTHSGEPQTDFWYGQGQHTLFALQIILVHTILQL